MKNTTGAYFPSSGILVQNMCGDVLEYSVYIGLRKESLGELYNKERKQDIIREIGYL